VQRAVLVDATGVWRGRRDHELWLRCRIQSSQLRSINQPTAEYAVSGVFYHPFEFTVAKSHCHIAVYMIFRVVINSQRIGLSEPRLAATPISMPSLEGPKSRSSGPSHALMGMNVHTTDRGT
jgi:hypothetical protein